MSLTEKYCSLCSIINLCLGSGLIALFLALPSLYLLGRNRSPLTLETKCLLICLHRLRILSGMVILSLSSFTLFDVSGDGHHLKYLGFWVIVSFGLLLPEYLPYLRDTLLSLKGTKVWEES